MTDDDEDIRAALARAHEPAPPFAALATRRRSSRSYAVIITAAVAAVAAVGVVVAWPRGTTPTSPDAAVALDLSSPALSQTSLVMPLDSLLEVPELAPLGTLPQLGTGGLP